MQEEEKKLYPFKFSQLVDEYVWGSEEFEIADLGYRDSIVRGGFLSANSLSEIMEMYMDRVVGENSFKLYGRLFPIQIKKISCSGMMPLRVHPDDEISSQRYDSLGKEKMWYILSAKNNARLLLGFAKATDASELLACIEAGSTQSLMNSVPVKAGECYRIEPGTVHAALGELEIVEVSQASALDFLVDSFSQSLGEQEFDPSMNVFEALDFITYSPYKSPETELKQFKVDEITLDKQISIDTGESFSALYCLEGGANLSATDDVLGQLDYSLQAQQALLVPQETGKFTLSPTSKGTRVLVVFVEHSDEN